MPFAMAEQRQLPSLIGKVHPRFFTPHVAILCTAAVMFVLTLKQSFVQALTISAIARLLTYAATCAALPVLRRTNAPPALFRLRGGTIISVLALLLSGWLLLNSTLKEAVTAAIAAFVGLLVYLGYRLVRNNRKAEDG